MTRDSRGSSESEEQEKIVALARAVQDVPGLEALRLLHASANGGSRHPAEAAKLKRMGVLAGVPDLCLPEAIDGWHGLYIEVKGFGGVVSAEQRVVMDDLAKAGYCVRVAFGFLQAWRQIELYLGVSILATPEKLGYTPGRRQNIGGYLVKHQELTVMQPSQFVQFGEKYSSLASSLRVAAIKIASGYGDTVTGTQRRKLEEQIGGYDEGLDGLIRGEVGVDLEADFAVDEPLQEVSTVPG